METTAPGGLYAEAHIVVPKAQTLWEIKVQGASTAAAVGGVTKITQGGDPIVDFSMAIDLTDNV